MASQTNGHTNGNGDHAKSKFDPNFTQHVIDLMSPETTPRNREILSSLIRHIHDFCREVELTQEEWLLGVNYINSLGMAYKKNRNETWRLCDILGVES
jgi:catechol 1,2-dioxygenase